MSARVLAKGLLTWVPGLQRTFFDAEAGGGTGSAAYCYGVWMKHLALLHEAGMQEIPHTVLELGPGASIGTGVATLLSGAERYVAIDAVAHMRPEANSAVLRDLEGMFRERAPRPVAGWPAFDHLLDDGLFPSGILDDARLAATLAPVRLARIEEAVRAVAHREPDPMIEYHTWSSLQPVADASVDLAFAHVVMSQVNDIEDVYARCGRWVRPGGWMSHQIDFSSMGTADEWNGHLEYTELAWKIIAGRRPYFVNRERLGTHLALMQRAGFDLVRVLRDGPGGGVSRETLAPRWRGISDEDLATETAFVIARRRSH
jgi:hypothetical protein